jgi:hypothetical protein
VILVGHLELHSLSGVGKIGAAYRGRICFSPDLISKEKGGPRAAVPTVLQQRLWRLLCGSDCLQQGSKS